MDGSGLHAAGIDSRTERSADARGLHRSERVRRIDRLRAELRRRDEPAANRLRFGVRAVQQGFWGFFLGCSTVSLASDSHNATFYVSLDTSQDCLDAGAGFMPSTMPPGLYDASSESLCNFGPTPIVAQDDEHLYAQPTIGSGSTTLLVIRNQ